MPAVSFSKESSEHNSQAFQKAQMGGGANTCVWTHCLLVHQHYSCLGNWSHPMGPFFTFKQSWNTPVKTGDKKGKYKEVQNNKQKSKFDFKQCWGTTKQNKENKIKQNQTPKLGSFWEGWTTKHSSKTIHYSSTEKKKWKVLAIRHLETSGNQQLPWKDPSFQSCVSGSHLKYTWVRGCPDSSLLELLGVKCPKISTLELQFSWRCGGPLTGYCWGSCSSW